MKYLDRQEQSAYLRERWGLQCKPQTLACKAVRGGGPKYVVIGRRALSTEEWLDEWAPSQISPPRRFAGEAVADAR